MYRLIDPRNGETLFVGKGKGNRVFDHMKLALKVGEADEPSDKLQTIRDIQGAGLQVIHVIHRHGLDEEAAFEVEAAVIDAYPGSTDIAGGMGSGGYGPRNAVATNSVYDAACFCWKIDASKAAKADYVVAVRLRYGPLSSIDSRKASLPRPLSQWNIADRL